MKFIYSIYFSFLIHMPILWAQPGHRIAYISINYEFANGIPQNTLLKDYDIRIGVFTENDSLHFDQKTLQELDSMYIHHYGHGEMVLSQKSIDLPIVFSEKPNSIPNMGNRLITRGSVVGLSLENKKTKQQMNIFVRLGKTLKVLGDDYITLIGLQFRAGNFFYDLCKNRYSQTEERFGPSTLILDNINKHAIIFEDLRQILKENDCTGCNFLFLLSITLLDNKKFNFYIYYEDHWDKTYRPKTIPPQDSVFRVYDVYSSQNKKSKSILGIFAHNTKEDKKMLIYFKIYKRYAEYNKNQITLKNFRFQEGIFYYDMETYQESGCETSKFIEEFDLSNIQEYAITEEKMNKILEDNNK